MLYHIACTTFYFNHLQPQRLMLKKTTKNRVVLQARPAELAPLASLERSAGPAAERRCRRWWRRWKWCDWDGWPRPWADGKTLGDSVGLKKNGDSVGNFIEISTKKNGDYYIFLFFMGLIGNYWVILDMNNIWISKNIYALWGLLGHQINGGYQIMVCGDDWVINLRYRYHCKFWLGLLSVMNHEY